MLDARAVWWNPDCAVSPDDTNPDDASDEGGQADVTIGDGDQSGGEVTCYEADVDLSREFHGTARLAVPAEGASCSSTPRRIRR